MSKLGDTKRAYELGKRGGCLYIWADCVCCEKERWVTITKTGNYYGGYLV